MLLILSLKKKKRTTQRLSMDLSSIGQAQFFLTQNFPWLDMVALLSSISSAFFNP